MIVKEAQSIRHDDEVLKLFKNNKNITVVDIVAEAEEYKFWNDMMHQFGVPQEEIDRLFSTVTSADELAEKVYELTGNTVEYKLAFAESAPITLSEDEEDSDDFHHLVLVVYEEDNDLREFTKDHDADSFFEELADTDADMLSEDGILGAVQYEYNLNTNKYEIRDKFANKIEDANVVNGQAENYLDVLNDKLEGQCTGLDCNESKNLRESASNYHCNINEFVENITWDMDELEKYGFTIESANALAAEVFKRHYNWIHDGSYQVQMLASKIKAYDADFYQDVYSNEDFEYDVFNIAEKQTIAALAALMKPDYVDAHIY